MLQFIPLDIWAAAALALAIIFIAPNPAPAILSVIYLAIWAYVVIKTLGDEPS